MANYDSNISAIAEHLESGENILASCYGAYETKSLGSKTVKNGIMVATEKRIIMYGKRFSGYNLETFPYEKISAIEVSKGFMGKSISIKMSGNESELKWIQKGDPDAVVTKARELMAPPSSGAGKPSDGNNDVLEQIKKLAELKEAGILSESEFETKKTDLLSRI